MGTRTCPDRSRLGLVVQLNRKRKKTGQNNLFYS